MNIKKTFMYLMEWLIPSSTAVYIILASYFNSWGTYYFWNYPMNIPAYVIACTTGALIYYPVNKYIFKHSINIKINGQFVEVKDGGEYKL